MSISLPVTHTETHWYMDKTMRQTFKLIWLCYFTRAPIWPLEGTGGEQSVKRLAMIKLSVVASGLTVVRNNKDLWFQPRTSHLTTHTSNLTQDFQWLPPRLILLHVLVNKSEEGKIYCKLEETGWTSIIEIIELHTKIIGNDFCNNQSAISLLLVWSIKSCILLPAIKVFFCIWWNF